MQWRLNFLNLRASFGRSWLDYFKFKTKAAHQPQNEIQQQGGNGDDRSAQYRRRNNIKNDRAYN